MGAARQAERAVLGELQGIAEQVDQGLARACCVAAQQRGHLRVEFPLQLEGARAGAGQERTPDVLQFDAQVEIVGAQAQLAGLDRGQERS